jgi:hypothetical protein
MSSAQFKASQSRVHVKGESMGEGEDGPVPNNLHQYMDNTCVLTCPTLKASNIICEAHTHEYKRTGGVVSI